jgi:hypothetical protein
MVGNAQAPVVVSANAGLVDGAQAALRSLGLLIAFAVAVVGFVRTKDIAGLAAYVHANGGQATAAASAIIGFAIYLYGVYKTHKRGAQIASVASNPSVKDSVARIK